MGSPRPVSEALVVCIEPVNLDGRMVWRSTYRTPSETGRGSLIGYTKLGDVRALNNVLRSKGFSLADVEIP